MAKKWFQKALSVGLSLTLCASLVAPALAADFTDLQEAINGTTAADGAETTANGTKISDENGGTYGYGWNETTKDTASKGWDIWAWDDNGTRNVQLNDTVTRGDKEREIKVEGKDVTLDLNGQTIVDEVPETYGRTIDVKSDSKLTVDDSSDEKTGAIQGNQYAILASADGAEVKIEGGSVTGGEYGLYLGGGAHGTVSGDSTTVKGSGAGVFANGTGTEVKIEGGSVIGDTRGLLVQVGAKGTVSGEKTTITGNTIGVQAAWVGTEVKIEGGSVTGQYGFYLHDGAHGTISGDSTTVEGTDYGVYAGGSRNEGKTEVNVEGGSVTGGKGGMLVQNGSKGTISGGSVSAENGGAGVYVRSYGEVPSQVTRTDGDISGNIVLFSDKTGDGTSEFTVGGVTYSLSAEPSEEETDKQVITIVVKDADGNPIGDTATTVTVDIGTKFMPELNTANTDNPRFELTEDMLDKTAVTTYGYGGYVDNTGFHPYPAPVPVTPAGDGGNGDEELADQAIPLADGPVTRAQFIDYLWRHEGEPASDGVCTFADVAGDHEYFAALCWAEENGVAVAYEDGNFQPDELVTVAAAREFLASFEAVFGAQAVAAADLASLTGADDEAVLNCDEVLAEFFGEEYAPAQAEDEAA